MTLRTRLQDSLGGKYRIIRELAGGGMSRVYLAEERDLEREVAIKVLNPDLVDATLLARFRQEMVHTARLQHPTIVPILETGTLDDGEGRTLPYYVMAYVRGESLRNRLLHEGQLSIALTTRILKNVLDALVHAHANGVIHRDIKPENVFISGTSAVLADFGIARVFAGSGLSDTITTPGTTVGTPTYMAPEQIAGEPPADQRADLYSLGVVAYEMLAGRLPWNGRTLTDVIAAKARHQIVPLRTIRPDVPHQLESLITTCLSWDPDDRPASANEVARAIDVVASTPSTPASLTTGSVVAVPRRWRPALLGAAVGVALLGAGAVAAYRHNDANASGPKSVQLAVMYPEVHFSEGGDGGLRELLYHLFTASLHTSGLRLVQEVSISQMADRGLKLHEVADTLRASGVDSVLVIGAAPSAGGAYRLTVELRSLQQESAETIAGPVSVSSLTTLGPDSVMKLVKLLSAQVVARFGLEGSAAIAQTANREAFAEYTAGRDAYTRRTRAAVLSAIDHYTRAIELDPTYAQAHADLATALASSLLYHYRQDSSSYEVAHRALASANRAIELQPSNAEGYLARGYVTGITGGSGADVKKDYATAQKYSSASPYSQIWYVNILFADGKYGEAFERIQEEVRRDPKSPAHWVSLALYALPAGKYDTAAAVAARARRRQPELHFLADLELWGRYRSGGAALAECGMVDPGPYLGVWALCLESLQHDSEAHEALATLKTAASTEPLASAEFDRALYAGELAAYYAAHGDVASARKWLIQAYDDSPAGIDYRVMRAGVFPRELVALSDTLRAKSWSRVRSASGQ